MIKRYTPILGGPTTWVVIVLVIFLLFVAKLSVQYVS